MEMFKVNKAYIESICNMDKIVENAIGEIDWLVKTKKYDLCSSTKSIIIGDPDLGKLRKMTSNFDKNIMKALKKHFKDERQILMDLSDETYDGLVVYELKLQAM